MKAYHVVFETAGTSGFSEVLLVKEENELEKALEAKTTKSFRAGHPYPYSKIINKTEIPLSKVKIAELSVTEFLSLRDMWYWTIRE